MAAETSGRSGGTIEKTNEVPPPEDKPTEVESTSSRHEVEKNGKKTSKAQGNCYCGKDRNLNIAELLCANCNRWFHESCISYQLGKLVPFLSNYVFLCKNCSPTGLESFKKSLANITQMCITAIANLQQTSVKEGASRSMFNKEKEIVPFIEYYWEALTTTPRRVTQSWHVTVYKALNKDLNILFNMDETVDGQTFGLICSDLTQIKPNYEAMIKGGTLRVTDMGIQHGNESLWCIRWYQRIVLEFFFRFSTLCYSIRLLYFFLFFLFCF